MKTILAAFGAVFLLGACNVTTSNVEFAKQVCPPDGKGFGAVSAGVAPVYVCDGTGIASFNVPSAPANIGIAR